MPIVSQFYGIIVRMYYDDNKQHNVPHVHVQYAENKAIYNFDGNCIKGKLQIKQAKMVEAWIMIHSEELQLLWEIMQDENDFFSIDPLK